MNPNLERALLLYQQSRHEQAEDELRQALASEPDDAYAHAMLALCLAHREKFDEATTEAGQAIHLKPDFSFAYYAQARVLYDRNRFPEARVAIEEAIRLDSVDADYFSLLAGIHFQEYRWQDALNAAEQGLQFDPGHVGCTNLRAMAMVKLGRKAEAGRTIDAALSKNPGNALTHTNQGWTLLEKGDPKKALEHFREALRLDPENEWARRGIVEALKARNIVYAVMLKYFLWMSHFSKRGQWMIVLGAYFGNRMLAVLAATDPKVAPWILPLRIAYICFLLMTWMAYPFFNLLLRVNRFGRYALSRDQTVASNWFGLCLLCGLIALAGCGFYGFDSPWIIAAMVFGFLLLPVSGTYRCASGWPRNVMAGLTISLALSGLGAVAIFAGMEHLAKPGGTGDSTTGGLLGLLLVGSVGWGLFGFCGIGSAASTWIVNILRSQTRRR